MNFIMTTWDLLKTWLSPKRSVKPHVEPPVEIMPTGRVFETWPKNSIIIGNDLTVSGYMVGMKIGDELLRGNSRYLVTEIRYSDVVNRSFFWGRVTMLPDEVQP